MPIIPVSPVRAPLVSSVGDLWRIGIFDCGRDRLKGRVPTAIFYSRYNLGPYQALVTVQTKEQRFHLGHVYAEHVSLQLFS